MSVNIKGVLKGSAFSILITFFLIFILSLIAYFTRINESTVTVMAYGAVIIGILVGSVVVAGGAPNKKFLHVLLVCAVYTVVLIGISVIANGGISFNGHMAAIIGGIFAAAFLGLVIGNRNN